MSGARKFGGAFSPGGGGADAPQPRRKAKGSGFSWRVLGLYLAPTLLLFPGIWGIMAADARLIAWALGGWAALIFAAWMTGEGVKAAEAYDARAVARAPALPRKVIGAVIMAASVTAIAFLGLKLGLFSIVYGLVVGGAHIMAFGVDPMRAKGEGVIPGQVERVADKICEAEAVVDEARAAGKKLRDDRLLRRIEDLAFSAQDILREIETDPRDLVRARRFLSVHLVGLRDATVKFAAAREKGAAESLRPQYEALLTDLEQSFSSQKQKLLANDQTELEVEIEVLRDRLKQENAL